MDSAGTMNALMLGNFSVHCGKGRDVQEMQNRHCFPASLFRGTEGIAALRNTFLLDTVSKMAAHRTPYDQNATHTITAAYCRREPKQLEVRTSKLPKQLMGMTPGELVLSSGSSPVPRNALLNGDERSTPQML